MQAEHDGRAVDVPPLPDRPAGSAVRLAANLFGTGWAALLGLAVVPTYLRLIGVEAYGLMSFYVSLTTLIQVFDLGLSPALNRELARLSTLANAPDDARDLVRTLELGYWAIAFALGLIVWAAAPWLAVSWFKAEALSTDTLRSALVVMAALTMLQWPISLYQGGLIGLQKQVLFNALWAAYSTARHLGAIVVLMISPSVVSFFLWQVVVSAAYVLALAIALWRSLPSSARSPRPRRELARSIGRFALGMSAITLTALILTQIDKVVLSTALDLTHFGYYTLANTVAGAVGMVAGPVFNLDFPRLSAFVAQSRSDDAVRLYHRSAQVMSALILPIATTLVLFADSILLVWTHDPLVTAAAAPLVRLLTIGAALNALGTPAYAVQLAYGWTRLAVILNVVLIAVFLPALLILEPRFSGQAAAGLWVALNVVYMAISIPLTHRRLIGGGLWVWARDDVARPLLVCLAVGLAGYLAKGWLTVGWIEMTVIAGLTLLAVAVSTMAMPQTRALAVEALTRWRA